MDKFYIHIEVAKQRIKHYSESSGDEKNATPKLDASQYLSVLLSGPNTTRPFSPTGNIPPSKSPQINPRVNSKNNPSSQRSIINPPSPISLRQSPKSINRDSHPDGVDGDGDHDDDDDNLIGIRSSETGDIACQDLR